MTKTFAIFGAIVPDDSSRQSMEDLTPAQFRSFVQGLEDGDELVIQINSVGGDVFAGIAIANTIKQISANHKTVCIVEGLAASIASVILCACDKIQLHSSSMVMIHNCWSVVQGDSNTLRKEADMMDKLNDAIISFYLSKFGLSAEELKKLMDDETWFSGEEAENFKLACEVIPDDEGYRIAAKVKDFDLSKFAHTPRALKELTMENKEEIKQADTVQAEEPTVVENTADETTATPDVEEPKEETPAEVKAEETPAETAEEETPKADAEETITKAEADKRVFGMQSTMAKKLDALRKEYDAKIMDFENQLKIKDEELAKATSLVKDLESAKATNAELSKRTSALESELAEKITALDKLNVGVLTPAVVSDAKPWTKLHGDDLLKWCREHNG